MSIGILRKVILLTPKPLCLSSLSSAPSLSSDHQTPPPDPLISSVVSVLTHQRSKSRWSTLLSLYPSGFSPAQFSEIVLCIKNNPHLALRFFVFTRRRSLCTHNLLSYSTLIHILSRARLKSRAQDLIRLAIRSAGAQGAGDVSCGSESKILLKLFESLVKTYKRCGSAPFVFDLLIKSCLESKKIDGSIEIVRMLRSRGISPLVSTCNALVWEVSRRRGASAGYEVYAEVFGLNSEVEGDVKWVAKVRPNVHTFNALMVCFHRQGEMEKVEEIWREMAELGCNADVYSYTVMMAVLCEGGKIREAEKLWEEMRVKGLEHDVAAYNTIIGGFCRVREMVRAEEFFKEMGLSGKESTCVTYEHLIKGYCKVGDVDQAMLVYKDMRRKDFRPEASTMHSLTKGLCDKCRVFEALKMIKVAISDFGFCPKGESYEFLIKGLCEEGKMDEAFKLQAEMVGRGFKPNVVIYSAFIDGYVNEGNDKMAESLRMEMLEALKGQEED